jgi:hypothetical protein
LASWLLPGSCARALGFKKSLLDHFRQEIDQQRRIVVACSVLSLRFPAIRCGKLPTDAGPLVVLSKLIYTVINTDFGDGRQFGGERNIIR